MKYDIILADPPWKYNARRHEGTRFGLGVHGHYPTLDTGAIAELPVSRLAADPAILFLWATWPRLLDALVVLTGWGFTYKTIGFLWVKLNPRRAVTGSPKDLKRLGLAKFLSWLTFFGIGYYAASNTEPCLLATRGSYALKPHEKPSSVVYAPRGPHSQKPIAVVRRIERMYPPGAFRHVELFARESRPGWTTIGNEIDGRDIREVLND